MKKYIIISLAIALSSMQSCVDNRFSVRPSRDISTFNTSADSFTELEVEDAFEVFITFSDNEESIEVEANDNLHDYIEIESYKGRLEIGLQRGVNIRGDATLKVFITTKNIDMFDISGASRVELESVFRGRNLDVRLSGASTFDAKVEANRMICNLSGASKCELGGVVDVMEAELSGASRLEDYDLDIEELYMNLSGASSARLTVEGLIELDASGASTLRYRGDAVIQHLDLSGASNIIKD